MPLYIVAPPPGESQLSPHKRYRVTVHVDDKMCVHICTGIARLKLLVQPRILGLYAPVTRG